jgi:hypothetical protein
MTTSTPPQPDTADRLKNSTTSVDVNAHMRMEPGVFVDDAPLAALLRSPLVGSQ